MSNLIQSPNGKKPLLATKASWWGEVHFQVRQMQPFLILFWCPTEFFFLVYFFHVFYLQAILPWMKPNKNTGTVIGQVHARSES